MPRRVPSLQNFDFSCGFCVVDCVFKLPPHFGFQGVPHHQLPPQYQKIVERLKAVEQEISGGAMAIVAVVLNNKLYIANVGELFFVSTSV